MQVSEIIRYIANHSNTYLYDFSTSLDNITNVVSFKHIYKISKDEDLDFLDILLYESIPSIDYFKASSYYINFYGSNLASYGLIYKGKIELYSNIICGIENHIYNFVEEYYDIVFKKLKCNFTLNQFTWCVNILCRIYSIYESTGLYDLTFIQYFLLCKRRALTYDESTFKKFFLVSFSESAINVESAEMLCCIKVKNKLTIGLKNICCLSTFSNVLLLNDKMSMYISKKYCLSEDDTYILLTDLQKLIESYD